MRKLAFLLVCLVVTGEASLAATPQGVECALQFFEKRIYYLDDPDSPIRLQVTVVNNSPDSLHLQVADSRVFNLDFAVTTPTNLELEHSKKYTEVKGKNQPVFYRDMSLAPGEKFGMVVELADFIRIDAPGQYLVQALFYPQMGLSGEAEAWKSAKLGVNVRPALTRPEEKARLDVETGVLLQRDPLAPDEVVGYTLRARQKSQWEKFFLYLDLPSLYRYNEQRGRQYDRMSEEQRRAVIEEFKGRLKGTTVDQDIQLIPSTFDVLKTSYTRDQATVIVRETFKQRDYTEVKQFTYQLVRQDRVWLITAYEVVNQGTE